MNVERAALILRLIRNYRRLYNRPMPPGLLARAVREEGPPNLEYVIYNVRGSQAWDFTTKDGLCAYQNACVVALHEADPDFGQLVKTEGQNHCTDPSGKFCATDVALYRPTGQIIDFIQSAGYGTPPPENNVTWHVGPLNEYPASSWFAPTAGTDGGGTPPEPPDTGDGGSGTDPAIVAQLARIEQNTLETKLLSSNMNEQLALQGGVINQLFAQQFLVGPLGKPGDELRLTRTA